MFTIARSARFGAAVAGLALPVLLAACGGTATAPTGTQPTAPSAVASASATPGVSAQHNDADVSFAQMMIPHHQQAVEMAQLAAERANSPEVKALAQQIQAAQDPEIATLTGFLQAWGAPAPATGSMGGMDHGGMSGMNHGDMSGTNQQGMPGMMTSDQMNQLQNADGTAFDTMFLQMMIAHHQGAVTDAQRELTDGANPEAKALAQTIIDAQTAEITRMQQLLQAG